MENVTAKVKQRMEELRQKLQAELEDNQKKQEDAQAQLQAAKDAADKATRATDLKAYQKAKAEEAQAAAAVEMYGSRIKQLYGAEIVTEKESDATIDSLLQYEKALDREYLAAIKKKLEEVREIQNTYKNAIRDTESTITTWSSRIRANYRTFGRTTYTDPTTGKTTTRSQNPVPVHVTPYDGVPASNILDEFFNHYDMVNNGKVSAIDENKVPIR